MAENLVGFVNSGSPYLHSTPRNFRWQVHNLISGSAISGNASEAKDLGETIERLGSVSAQLKNEAEKFLSPWHGDYKRASQELFGTTQTDSKNSYAVRLKSILNSVWFIELVRSHYDYVIDEEEIQGALEEYNIKLMNEQIGTGSTVEARLEEYTKSIIKKMVDSNKNSGRTGKRVYLDGFEKLITFVLGEVEQNYFKDPSSLEKRIQQGLQKRYKVVNWEKLYKELQAKFLSYFPKDDMAKTFIDTFKPLFLQQTKKLKAVEKSNISGFIAENLQASIINSQTLGVTVHDLGDLTEDQIMELVKGLDVTTNHISKMTHRGNSATQSGSDWIIVNSEGMMVRAQVKNSLTLAEEFENKGAVSTPAQTLKLHDGIKYQTLQQNMKNYGKGNGLTDQDWAFLDYLIANMLWIRAGGSVTQDKGANYKSGVSGIQDLVNKLLTKEIGYFLGVTLDFKAQEKAVAAVVGASNIFFVIDNLVLYPTYKLIDNIILQLTSVKETFAKLHITLGNDYNAGITPSELLAKKQDIQQRIPWSKGSPYGEEMLKTGREYGSNLVSSLSIQRVNLNISINDILKEIYSTVLNK